MSNCGAGDSREDASARYLRQAICDVLEQIFSLLRAHLHQAGYGYDFQVRPKSRRREQTGRRDRVADPLFLNEATIRLGASGGEARDSTSVARRLPCTRFESVRPVRRSMLSCESPAICSRLSRLASAAPVRCGPRLVRIWATSISPAIVLRAWQNRRPAGSADLPDVVWLWISTSTSTDCGQRISILIMTQNPVDESP
jgi:hypothetical protein